MDTIEIRQIGKTYGNVQAVKDASFTVPENCLFGLIGPDGAGKTTLFRLITTLLLPDKGDISVFGMDTKRDYRQIRLFTGYMPGRFSLYPDLTVEENLDFYATIFGTTVKANYHLIEPIYALLAPYRKRLSKNLSGGMKQKLALSCAMIHNPRLLVLDEPTTGVDAVSRKEFWDTLQILSNSGMTILVSTPYMDEAVRCEKIALMQKGEIMVNGAPKDILGNFGSTLLQIRTNRRFDALAMLRSMKEVKSVYLFGQSIHATTLRGIDAAWLQANLRDRGIDDIQIEPIPPDFEDCFIDAIEHKQNIDHNE